MTSGDAIARFAEQLQKRYGDAGLIAFITQLLGTCRETWDAYEYVEPSDQQFRELVEQHRNREREEAARARLDIAVVCEICDKLRRGRRWKQHSRRSMKAIMPANRKTAETISVPIDKLILHPAVPRTEFATDDLEAIAGTAKQAGILNPPLAREIDYKCYTHQLLAGARRLAATVVFGWKSIDVRLLSFRDEKAAWALVGIEQLERKDWSLIQRATYRRGLCDPDRGGCTYTQAAELFGRKDRSWTCHNIALLDLPTEARNLLHAGELLDLARGGILCRYRERPEIVSAISKEIERRPEAWTPRSKFEASAARVAARFESPKQTATVATVAGPRINATPAKIVRTPSATRRAAPDPVAELIEPPAATRPITQNGHRVISQTVRVRSTIFAFGFTSDTLLDQGR